MQRTNVFGNVPALTQSSYRSAVASIIRAIQTEARETDQDTADRIGVSAQTVYNARNQRGDLNAVTLLRIGKEYGLDAIQPAMLLIEAKAAPVEAVCSSDREMPVHVSEAQLFLARALCDNNQIDDHEIRDNPEAIEKAGQVFDVLRWRLNSLRVRGECAA